MGTLQRWPFLQARRTRRAAYRDPRLEDVVSRLDLDNFVAVLEAMRLRKGFYGPPTPVPRTDAQRELYRRKGLAEAMIDQIEESAERQVAHDQAVRRIRDRLVDRFAP